jgi:hypothetical protein
MKGTLTSFRTAITSVKGKIIFCTVTILLALPLCAAQSSCEEPVTNNYYTNSNNTTNNYYYGTSPVTGAPSITPDFINKMLCKYGNSQVCGTGQALYQDGQTYNIDPTFALAFFWHESNFGTQGEARYSKSLGNLRCIDNEASCTDGYAWFNSWEDGYNAWYDLISNLYIKQWGLNTIDTIIPKYAPAADHNNEQAYINNVCSLINTWRSGNATIYTA